MLRDWGTVKQRLGSESFKEFNSCCLCLNSAINPVSCASGHLFCKECIYTNIISQKRQYRERKNAWKTSIHRQSMIKAEEEKITKEKEIKKFTSNENGLNGRENWEKFDDNRKYNLMSEEKRSHARAKAFLQSKDKRLESKQELIQKSFWVPEVTPENEAKIEQKPSKILKCPENNHKITLKSLQEIKAENDATINKYIYRKKF